MPELATITVKAKQTLTLAPSEGTLTVTVEDGKVDVHDSELGPGRATTIADAVEFTAVADTTLSLRSHPSSVALGVREESLSLGDAVRCVAVHDQFGEIVGYAPLQESDA